MKKNLKMGLIDTIYYFLSKLFPGISGLLCIAIYTRMVGIENYGIYSLFIYQFNLIASFSFGWINQSVLRYNTDLKKKINFNILLLPAPIIIALILILNFNENLAFTNFLLFFFCVFNIGIFSSIKTIFQAQLLSSKVLILTIIQSMLIVLIPAIIYQLHELNIVLLIACTAVSFFISILFSLIIKFNKKNKFQIKFGFLKFSLLKKWFKYGFPVSVWASIGLLFPYLDRFFISIHFNNDILGKYSALNEITIRAFSFFLFPFIMALHPRITGLWNRGSKKRAVEIIFFGVKCILILLPLSFFLLHFLNKEIFYLIKFVLPMISSDYLPIFTPMVLTGILWQLSFLTQKMIELNEKTYYMIYFILFSLVINLVGNIFFLPKYGVIATAYTSFLSSFSYCAMTTIYLIITKKQI